MPPVLDLDVPFYAQSYARIMCWFLSVCAGVVFVVIGAHNDIYALVGGSKFNPAMISRNTP